MPHGNGDKLASLPNAMPTQFNSDTAGLNSDETEQVKAELALVLQSQGFKRSERHSRFLRFVCEAALSGEAGQLNEYLIAHRVFDRGSSYSSGEDSVVRRQAYSLRQKLQEYYTAEGKHHSVRIDLPVGRYVPTFNFAETHTPSAPALPVGEPEAKPQPESVRIKLAVWKGSWARVLAVSVIAMLCGGRGMVGRF